MIIFQIDSFKHSPLSFYSPVPECGPKCGDNSYCVEDIFPYCLICVQVDTQEMATIAHSLLLHHSVVDIGELL